MQVKKNQQTYKPIAAERAKVRRGKRDDVTWNDLVDVVDNILIVKHAIFLSVQGREENDTW